MEERAIKSMEGQIIIREGIALPSFITIFPIKFLSKRNSIMQKEDHKRSNIKAVFMESLILEYCFLK